MQQTTTKLPEMKLIGITCRTNNASEMNSATAKIGAMIARYAQEEIAQQIPLRKSPMTTYSAYTDYASDMSGDYTYFVGEEVESLDDIPSGLAALTIPAQQYTKITTEMGAMPMVCISAWQQIWQDADLGVQRSYATDFELYDIRAKDPQNTVLDIFIGVNEAA
ncbi:MAG: GyrI-like domain-containing protein [Rickettsiales bacterium]